jgi:Ca2+:H+ antiporter
MPRWLYPLLVAVPVAFIVRAAGAPPLLVFILAALGLIPLAGLISVATERLAERLGARIGGLLNATFGNAAELIISIVALAAGLPDVVRASIAGSIIGNALLVLGTAMLFGGWRHGTQRFDARAAGQYASMLALAVVGLVIPSIIAHLTPNGSSDRLTIGALELHELSSAVAVILLVSYVAFIAFSVFGLHAEHSSMTLTASAPLEDLEPEPPAAADHGDQAQKAPRMQASGQSFSAQALHAWEHTIWGPAVVLALATVLTAVASEALVGSIEPVAADVGLSPFFVGLIVLPIVGNAAEHASAVTTALRNHMETSMAITAGSSIQVALFVAPVLVLISPLLGTAFDLDFIQLELVIFALVTVIYAIVSLDGESTWLEGFLLLAFYLIVAAGSFFVPLPV